MRSCVEGPRHYEGQEPLLENVHFMLFMLYNLYYLDSIFNIHFILLQPFGHSFSRRTSQVSGCLDYDNRL